MDKTETELLPCPFCGNAPQPVPQNSSRPNGTDWWQFIWCEHCDTQGPERIDGEAAIAAWNKPRTPPTQTDWQDISTAPKDGTTILCYFPLEGLTKDWCRVVPVFFDSRGGRPPEWIFASRAASGFSRGFEPTHWQPLPTPPTQTPGK